MQRWHVELNSRSIGPALGKEMPIYPTLQAEKAPLGKEVPRKRAR